MSTVIHELFPEHIFSRIFFSGPKVPTFLGRPIMPRVGMTLVCGLIVCVALQVCVPLHLCNLSDVFVLLVRA